MTQESSLIVTGIVRADARAPGIPGGFEIDVSDLQVVQDRAEYPDHAQGTRRRVPDGQPPPVAALVAAVGHPARPRDHRRAMRDWLDDHGFILVDTPILTPAAAEGTTTLFEIDYLGEQAYLAQTGQLYNEANIFAFGRVYCFGPTFRAEKSKTRRHLQEFWMVEPEIAFCDLDQLLEIEEQFVSYIVQTRLKECAAELKLLERDTTHLRTVVPPFPRIRYDEAVEMINEAAAQGVDGAAQRRAAACRSSGATTSASPHETWRCQPVRQARLRHHYPTAVKAFYMEP